MTRPEKTGAGIEGTRPLFLLAENTLGEREGLAPRSCPDQTAGGIDPSFPVAICAAGHYVGPRDKQGTTR